MKLYTIAFLKIAAISVAISCASCGSGESFFLRYYFTAETEYFDAKISKGELTYIHVDEQWKEEQCLQWVAQYPCWTEDSLVTERTTLSESEIDDLRNIVEESDFKILSSYYGPDNSRCYSHEIEVVTDEMSKTVNFCSSPQGPEEPVAFRAVREKVQEIVKKKFDS